jgi:hypothetical protein
VTDECLTHFGFIEPIPDHEPALRIPPIIARQIEARLTERLDELAKLVSTSCKEALADKIRVLCTCQWASSKSTTRAVRRARIDRLVKLAEAFGGDTLDLLMPMQRDDPHFLHSPAVKAIVEALQPVHYARDALLAEQAKLPPPSKADHCRTTPPSLYFMVNAHILWMEETRTRPRKHGVDYRQWLTILWEVATGEAGRTFSKALR